MTTALLKQALECLNWFVDCEMTVGQRYTNEGEECLQTITAIRDYLKREEALQRMVDFGQEHGLYDPDGTMPPKQEPEGWFSPSELDALLAKTTYAGRAVTTTVTDPAEIRKAFEEDDK